MGYLKIKNNQKDRETKLNFSLQWTWNHSESLYWTGTLHHTQIKQHLTSNDKLKPRATIAKLLSYK